MRSGVPLLFVLPYVSIQHLSSYVVLYNVVLSTGVYRERDPLVVIDTTTTGIIGSLSICIYGNTVLNHAWYTCVVNAAVNVSPFQKRHLHLSGIAHVCM